MTNQNTSALLGEDGEIEKLRELSDAAPAGPWTVAGDDIVAHPSGEWPNIAFAPGVAAFVAGAVNYVRAALARTNNTDPVRALAWCFRNKADDERAKASNREYAEWVRDRHHGAAGAYMDCARMADEAASAPPSATVGVEGVRRYLAARDAKPIRGMDPDVIHAIHTGTEWEAELRVSDLRAIAQQPAAPSAGQSTGITAAELGYALKRATPAQVIEYLEDDANMRAALSIHFEEQHDQQPAAPSGEAVGSDGRRERLLERRTALNNSFGNGAYEDGRVQQQIDAIDAELAALAAPQQPAAPSGEAVAWLVEREGDPTFPRAFTCESDADGWVRRVELPPFAKKRPLIYGDTAPQQPAADAYNRRLKAQLEQEWVELRALKRSHQQPAAVDGDEVRRVAQHIGSAADYIDKAYPGAKMLDRGPILRNMRRWHERLTAALAAQQQGGRADG